MFRLNSRRKSEVSKILSASTISKFTETLGFCSDLMRLNARGDITLGNHKKFKLRVKQLLGKIPLVRSVCNRILPT
jgi:hypothetical protein